MEEYLINLGFMNPPEKKMDGEDPDENLIHPIKRGVTIAHAREEFPPPVISKGKSAKRCLKKSCTSGSRSKTSKKR